MNLKFLNPDIFKSLKNSVEEEYLDFITQIRLDVKEDAESDLISNDFQVFLKSNIGNKKLSQYSDLNFYWINLIDSLIYLLGLHEEKDDEEVFSFWENTEYAEIFLKLESDLNSTLKSSSECIPFLESQIMSFFYLQIAQENYLTDLPLNYHVIPELGDCPEKIFIGEKGHSINLTKEIDSFPLIPFLNISFSNNSFEVDQDKEVLRLKYSKDSVNIEGLNIRNTFVENLDEDDFHVKRIKKAISIIKSTDENLFTHLKTFTHTIIPIDEPGIVSYSMQNLPGYSSINLFERDDVDLIDDLVHENGHHYLNCYLNVEELIIEDDEKIYFSPWRRSLRPIRGIYHATCTFFWAYYLFKKLILNSLDKFDSSQIIKIYSRFLEEKIMIEYTFQDLDHAFKEGKVTESGMSFINIIKSEINNESELFEQSTKNLKDLSSEHYGQFVELENLLKEKRIHYKL
tara:strand:+ start:33460 stop:34833 length:1374 start_codon:yes stop_codon:yes gene_type:complete